MKPIYDDRGAASIYISRFDPAIVPAIAEFPAIYWVELNIDDGNDLRAVREMTAQLLPSLADHLEYLEIANCNVDSDLMRAAIPDDPSCFQGLSVLDRVVFDRVDLTDRAVQAICRNTTLRDVDVRFADITRRCLRYFENCPMLAALNFSHCRHFPANVQEQLRKRLPHVSIVTIHS